MSINDRAKTIHEVFKRYGFSDQASAGAIGNLEHESGLQPQVTEIGGFGGYGLAQWTPKANLYTQGNALGFSNAQCERLEVQAEIIANATKVGQWTNVMSSQYDVSERISPLSFDNYKTMTNVRNATVNFMGHYLRPTYRSVDNKIYAERIPAAEKWYKYLVDGDGGGGGGGSDPKPDPKPPEYDWDDFFDGINDVVSGGLDKVSSNLFGSLDNLLKDLDRLLKELKENILEALKELFNSYMYDYSNQYKSNKYIQVMTTFKNMYKIKPTKLFYELINTVIDTGIKTIKDFMLGKVNDIKKSFTSGVSGIIDDIGNINKPPVINPEPDDPDQGTDNKPVIPTVSDYRFTSGYGFRTSPTTGKWTLHDGIDLAPKVPGTTGVPIYATQDGEVVENFWGDIQGWAVRIKHSADKYYSGYQHLSTKSPIGIGTKVRKGQKIGTMGATGLVTGVHLHFQIATTASGWYTDEGTIDPAKYLGL